MAELQVKRRRLLLAYILDQPADRIRFTTMSRGKEDVVPGAHISQAKQSVEIRKKERPEFGFTARIAARKGVVQVRLDWRAGRAGPSAKWAESADNTDAGSAARASVGRRSNRFSPS